MDEVTVAAPKALRIEISDGIATLTLDRADTLNALTMDTFRELRDLFRALQDDPFGQQPHDGVAASVRAVIITGAGTNNKTNTNIDELIGQVTRMGNAGSRA